MKKIAQTRAAFSGFLVPETLAPFLGALFTLASFLCPFFLSSVLASEAPQLDFATFRLGTGSRVVLVIGGIQGDEPGGFSAASLLATHYEIKKGAVWVVPNLNFPSIIKRSRGLHGDMNRKFAALDERDPEFATVRRVQDLIRRPEVALVLNLHDGSGYYRPTFEDRLRNPKRWGQSIIIDQEKLAGAVFMGDLAREAGIAASEANSGLVNAEHAIHVHNTNTAAGDREMEKSLSYYAVRNGKAAFGIEATKECPTPARTYYHLLMVESFLRMAGVEFSRDFELSPAGIELALSRNLGVAFAQNRIFLPLDDIRPAINFLPLPRGGAERAITSRPIMAVLPCKDRGDGLCIHYGNRTIAHIRPEWREMAEDVDSIPVLVDGEEKIAAFGQIVDVGDVIKIRHVDGLRVNAIGFSARKKDECEIPLRRKDFETHFSIDRAGRIFRVEVYRGDKLAGIFLLRFLQSSSARVANMEKGKNILPATAGRESSLGF